ncbi:xanthine dehydrogenase family protein molybdopterin-binding subunit [Streptomyces sp. B8F3]|uniref:xanthine dehydrogenase family protein molybdopterin-binding subunit n=1 Tax=Streptomyces sp. B8F3 TaxID=3153573 RepID=UPI00325DD6E4
MSRIVGSPVPRIDGRAKVTGTATYAADAVVGGTLHGFLATSTVARGRITGIDTEEAERSAGVVAVFTHRNMPRLTRPTYLSYLKSSIPLQETDIHHSGQPVAYVVAGTLEQAQHAATLIDVSYDTRRPRSAVADALDDAFVPPPGLAGPNETTRGDVAAGLADADVSVDVTYTTPMHHHNPLEPSTTTAVWDGGRVTVYESAQGGHATRICVSDALEDLPLGNVRVLSPFLGGGFGAKGPVWPHTLLTAAVARELGRPVKLVLSRAQTFTSNGHRGEAHQRLRIGARRDGTLTAIDHVSTHQVTRTEQGIFSTSHSTRVLYACPHVHVAQRAVRLDLSAPSFMRPPESVGSFGLESALDELSYALDMDPVELRLRNHTAVDPETGEPFGSRHLIECYRRGAAMFRWSERDPRPRSMRDGSTLIGWGMATAAHTTGGRPGAGARVVLSTAGRAVVQAGTHDIGTGTYTVMTQIAAQTLGLDLDDVGFELGDTDYPFAFMSVASATVPGVGAAVARACTAARRSLIGIAVADPRSPLHGVAAEQVTAEDGILYVTGEPRRRERIRTVLARHGRAVEATTDPVPIPPGYSVGAEFAEVRVDPRTGRVRVTRMAGAYDAGRVLNRRTLRSQALGGAVCAVGFALTEHTLVDPHRARVVHPNLSGYLVPVNADIPRIQTVFLDEPDPVQQEALGARGFGETPGTGMTAAIGNAVYHATGRRIRALPITPDKLL